MQISFSLQGKVALVTGGNGGIGRSIALGYKAMGATVIATGRNPDKNAAVAQELGHGHEVISLDVRDEGAVDQAVAAIAERHGRFDILVNNAGIARRTDILDMETADWHAVIDTHLNGGFYCAKAASKAMVNAGNGGKIINIGSMYSIWGPPMSPTTPPPRPACLALPAASRSSSPCTTSRSTHSSPAGTRPTSTATCSTARSARKFATRRRRAASEQPTTSPAAPYSSPLTLPNSSPARC